MEYNKNYANSFKYMLLFGKSIIPGEDVQMSVGNEKDILLAVKKAYIDMSPRTFESNNPKNKKELDSKGKDDLFNKLAKKFAEYIKDGANDFEVWHRDICNFFIEKFGTLLKDADKDHKQATYGKAQKIINMTFKYLYCYDDAEKYIARFEPCHMALDSYILNWYREEYNQRNKKKLTKTGKNSLPAWSNLTYEQYIGIQDNIKIYCKNPIEDEFLIWYQQKESK